MRQIQKRSSNSHYKLASAQSSSRLDVERDLFARQTLKSIVIFDELMLAVRRNFERGPSPICTDSHVRIKGDR